MIEKMFSVVTVAPLNRREEMIEKIRNMGVLHIADRHSADPAISLRFDSLSKTRLSLKEIPGSSVSGKVLSEEKFEELDASVLGAYSEIKNLSAERNRLSILVDQLKDWGRFEPEDIKSLASEGIELHFYRMGKKEYGMLGDLEDVRYVRLSPVGKTETVAVVGKKLDSDFPAVEFVMPEKGIGTLEEEIHSADVRIEQNNEILKRASQELSSYDAFILKYKNMAMMSSVTETSVSDDNLVWLCGYIPESDIGKFKAAAKSENWAYCISEPEAEDEKVPTKVKYNKVTGIIKPVFDILGTVPGYHEHDISFWFLCFFALFFAMIIGDAGYGLCFLAVAVALNVKQKKLTNLTLLVYLMSLSTVAWGAVTGTWFGLESAMDVPFLKAMVIPAIANYPEKFGMDAMTAQNNIMQFCFIIGTVQLSLACILNVKNKIQGKDLSFVADIGWLCAINAL